MRTLVVGLSIALGFSSHALFAADWFVRAGADGDGSMAKPFKDPWQALERAQKGDVIHVSAGNYFGRLEAGNWKVTLPSITLLGGYDENFSTRDPWKHPTILGPSTKGKTRASTGVVIESAVENVIVDGFVIDGRNFYDYDDKTDGYPSMKRGLSGPLVAIFGKANALKNSMVINGYEGLLRIGAQGRVENNVFMNSAGWRLVDVNGDDTVVQGNTLLFATGTGQWPDYRGGTCLFTRSERVAIKHNVFAFCARGGVDVVKASKTTLDDNVFWMNGGSHLTFFIEGSSAKIDLTTETMGDIVDAGFVSAKNNVVQNIGRVPFDAKWLERYVNHVTVEPKKNASDKTAGGDSNSTAEPKKGLFDDKIELEPLDPNRVTSESTKTVSNGASDRAESWSQIRTDFALPAAGGPAAFGAPYLLEHALLLQRLELTKGAHVITLAQARFDTAAPRTSTETTKPKATETTQTQEPTRKPIQTEQIKDGVKKLKDFLKF